MQPSSIDRDVRRYAVPVRGTIWGHNYNDRSERDIGYYIHQAPVTYSDYNDYFPGVDYSLAGATPINPIVGASQQCPLRILNPHFGGIVECYADLSITVAAADPDLTLKLVVGRFQSSSYDRVLTYTQAEIDASWLKIRGSNTPLSVSSGAISADLLNLLPAMYEYGNAEYREEAFVLILAFNKVPTLTGTFKFNYLNVHTSVTGVS